VIERVVQGGGAEGLDLADGAQDAVALGGERHEPPVLMVEAGQGDLIFRLHAGQQLGDRHLHARCLHAPRHAAARVHQDEQARGQGLRFREVLEALGPPVFEDAELRLPQVRHRPPVTVHGGRGEDDEVRAAGEARNLGRLCGHGQGGGQGEGSERPAHARKAHKVQYRVGMGCAW
jgi:hypothetical protein